MYYLQVLLLVFALARPPPAGATKGVKPRLKKFCQRNFLRGHFLEHIRNHFGWMFPQHHKPKTRDKRKNSDNAQQYP